MGPHSGPWLWPDWTRSMVTLQPERSDAIDIGSVPSENVLRIDHYTVLDMAALKKLADCQKNVNIFRVAASVPFMRLEFSDMAPKAESYPLSYLISHCNKKGDSVLANKTPFHVISSDNLREWLKIVHDNKLETIAVELIGSEICLTWTPSKEPSPPPLPSSIIRGSTVSTVLAGQKPASLILDVRATSAVIRPRIDSDSDNPHPPKRVAMAPRISDTELIDS